ncbi:MAG TPA: MFS transporter [Steroidobacteraceae bacterium]|nr:MFS transporter [Steroidobacteraceae bacterium]
MDTRPGRYRWLICGLLLAAMAINYVQRQSVGLLKGPLQHEFSLDENGYAGIVFWFQAAYAVGYVSFGRVLDRLGARAGYAIAFILWNLSHMAGGLAVNIMQFTLARIGLGLGESGAFPASLKAVAEWFPQRERALAAGIFNAGTNLGAIIAPAVVPVLTALWGWRSSFFVTGAVGTLWIIAWWACYRRPQDHPRVDARELALIEADPPDPVEAVAWWRLLRLKETWAYAGARFLIDPVWWFYLFWLPDFLYRTYHLNLSGFGPPLIAIYLISDLGSVLGGWSSSAMLRRGVGVNVARKLTLLVCAALVLPVWLVDGARELWMAVLLIGLAAAAHQAFSANLYTFPSDVLPRSAVASVSGIGGMMGAVGGMLFSRFVGQVLQAGGSYRILFLIAGSVYLMALTVIHVLSPRLRRVTGARVALI